MAQEEQHIDSVFDFLYTDIRRIRSWCSQVFNDGVLISHRKTSHVGESKGNEITGEIDASARINAIIADGQAKGSAKATSNSREKISNTLEQSFDASWSMEFDLLNRLDELGMINRDISSAPIGSLVLVTGLPKLMDVRFMQNIWDTAIDAMHAETKITHQNKVQLAFEKKKMKDIGALFQKLPPVPQLYLLDKNGNNFWSCFDEEYMTVNPSSLALMYGTQIDGFWSVLGILDAYPENVYSDAKNEIQEYFHGNEFITAYTQVLDVMRKIMGRPDQSYGITPLMMFRNVN